VKDPKGTLTDVERSIADLWATGITTDGFPTQHVRGRLGQVDYRYRRGGREVAKTVHFYLCEFESGDTADHDHEVDDARWMPIVEARRRLSYPGERAMIERALSILAANG